MHKNIAVSKRPWALSLEFSIAPTRSFSAKDAQRGMYENAPWSVWKLTEVEIEFLPRHNECIYGGTEFSSINLVENSAMPEPSPLIFYKGT